MSIDFETINRLQSDLPEFKIDTSGSDSKTIIGSLQINHVYNDFRVNESFDIEIVLPDEYPYAIPTVRETGNKINKKYPHIYRDGQLCLGIEGEIMLRCDGAINLKFLIDAYIVPYLFSYRYYERYNEYPFGERSHGGIGILESYAEYFDLENLKNTYDFLRYAISHQYRGHLPCPCNSSKKIRNCHGDILKRINESNSIKQILIKDLGIIDKELRKYEQYRKKTK